MVKSQKSRNGGFYGIFLGVGAGMEGMPTPPLNVFKTWKAEYHYNNAVY